MLASWKTLLHRIDLLDPPMLLLLTDDQILPDLHGLLHTTGHITDDAISISLVHLDHLQICGLLLSKVHHTMIWILGLLDRRLLHSLLPRMVYAGDLLVYPLLLVLQIVLLSSAARLLIIEVVIRLRLHIVVRESGDLPGKQMSGLRGISITSAYCTSAKLASTI